MQEEYFGDYHQLVILYGELAMSQTLTEELSEVVFSRKRKFLELIQIQVYNSS